jgi:large subunit ribosomal protein L10
VPTPQKAATIEHVRQWYDDSVALLFTEYRGLTVKEVTELRQKLRDAGAEYHIVKNTLFRRAMSHNPDAAAEQLLEGPTATAFITKNETECAKVLTTFLREHKTLVIKGASIGGRMFDAMQVAEFAKLPSREILLGQVVGLVQAPLGNVVGIMNEMIAGVVRLVGAIETQKSGA